MLFHFVAFLRIAGAIRGRFSQINLSSPADHRPGRCRAGRPQSISVTDHAARRRPDRWIHLYRCRPILAPDGSSIPQKLQRRQRAVTGAAYPELVLHHGIIPRRGGVRVLLLDDRSTPLLSGGRGYCNSPAVLRGAPHPHLPAGPGPVGDTVLPPARQERGAWNRPPRPYRGCAWCGSALHCCGRCHLAGACGRPDDCATLSHRSWSLLSHLGP